MNEINDQLEKQHDEIRALENEIQIYKADAEETIEEKKSKLKQIETLRKRPGLPSQAISQAARFLRHCYNRERSDKKLNLIRL